MEELLLPISITHNGGSSFTIDWDENDVATSFLNNWTVDDFQEAIRIGCAELLLDEVETDLGK